jgi:hypothetical protein
MPATTGLVRVGWAALTDAITDARVVLFEVTGATEAEGLAHSRACQVREAPLWTICAV